jgi:hypothetical protein
MQVFLNNFYKYYENPHPSLSISLSFMEDDGTKIEKPLALIIFGRIKLTTKSGDKLIYEVKPGLLTKCARFF